MTLTSDDVADLLQKWGSGPTSQLHDTPIEEAQERRTSLLSDVHAACSEGFRSGGKDIEDIAQKLGDGSRDGTFTQSPDIVRTSLIRYRGMAGTIW